MSIIPDMGENNFMQLNQNLPKPWGLSTLNPLAIFKSFYVKSFQCIHPIFPEHIHKQLKQQFFLPHYFISLLFHYYFI